MNNNTTTTPTTTTHPPNIREQHGAEVMRTLGIDPDGIVAGMAPLDERFGHTIVEYVFGEIVGRPELDLRTRQLATLAILTTLGGCEAQLELHLAATLRAGATRSEIVALLTHVSAYAGIPRVMNALNVAKRVLPPAADGPSTT
ncbi:carboxymuconolactone decarboxylase family protein [Streptomyces sp. MZ04]|uniref:carboxymuconolactone decarboxylase family protein n=1 Tax=Streptomyces sp. MZ04 TaxID=2559236 RepID=UPI00107E6963|nr:carboxymuconolactone decarboxylase family protein [Streptomyces sp. MZ04]TGB08484.1 carboxymuconolactone decarboxylase family protein [Streptomyces sp. MZ04]